MYRGLQPRAFAARPRQPDACACTRTRSRTWNLRVQSATWYRFHHPCAHAWHREWRSMPPPPRAQSKRAPKSACVMRARSRIHSNVGIQGVKGQGPSPPSCGSVAIPVTGQQKRAWRPARLFEIREADVPYRYGADSLLSRCAWHDAVRVNSCGSTCFATVFSNVQVPDCSGDTAASERTMREYMTFRTVAGDVARCKIRSSLRDASAR